MDEDFFRNIFKCCLFIAMSVSVLCAAYATLDLVVDGIEYREKGCNRNDPDPLGLREKKLKVSNQTTRKWEYEVKAPEIPSTVKNNEQFRTWYKTLTEAQRQAVKEKFLKDKMNIE